MDWVGWAVTAVMAWVMICLEFPWQAVILASLTAIAVGEVAAFMTAFLT